MKRTNILVYPLAATLLAILCNLLWGSAIPFINLGYRLFDIRSGEPAMQLLFAGIRFFLAGALTILFASVSQRKLVRPAKENWHKVCKLGMIQTVAQYVCFYIGVANTSSVKASLIQGLSAFVSILIASYLFRFEKMDLMKWLGGIIGVVGVTIVNLQGGKLDGSISFMGEGLLIMSMCASACSTGLIRRYSQTEDPVAMSGWQFMFGGVVITLTGLLMGGRLRVVSLPAVGVLLYLALLSAIAYTVWSLLLKYHPVSKIACFMFLQPIFGVILGILMLEKAENLPLLLYGAALVLVCLSIVILSRRKGEEKK